MDLDNMLYKLNEIFEALGYKEEACNETLLEDIITELDDVLDISLMIDANFGIECDYNVIEDAETVLDIVEHIAGLI